jgi:hypothetical protein
VTCSSRITLFENKLRQREPTDAGPRGRLPVRHRTT